MNAESLMRVNKFFDSNNLRQTEKSEVKLRMSNGETFIQAMVNIAREWRQDESDDLIFNGDFSTEYKSFALSVDDLLKGRIENPFNPFEWVIVRHGAYKTSPFRAYKVDDPYLQEHPGMYSEIKRTWSQAEAMSDTAYYNNEWDYSHELA